jgi:hypothetical protein
MNGFKTVYHVLHCSHSLKTNDCQIKLTYNLIFLAPVLCANILFFFSFVYNLCWGVWGSKASDPVSLTVSG